MYGGVRTDAAVAGLEFLTGHLAEVDSPKDSHETHSAGVAARETLDL